MNKEIEDLIHELATKMAVNDLMYDARVRYIKDYTKKLKGILNIFTPDEDKPICNSLFNKCEFKLHGNCTSLGDCYFKEVN